MTNDSASTNSNRNPKQEKFHRYGLLACSMVYTFSFVGSFFGWGPMQLLLEDNGSFHWKCRSDDNNQEEEEDNICAQQTAVLLKVPLIAQSTMLLSPLLGQFVDYYGPQRAAQAMAGCIWVGLACLTLASTSNNNPSLDRLLFLAFCLLAMGTWFGGLLTVQTGLYFCAHTKSRVIFLLNALFDAGSSVYLILWWIEDTTNSGLTAVAGGFLGFSILVYGPALYFWSVAVHDKQQEELPQQEEPQQQQEAPAATIEEKEMNGYEIIDKQEEPSTKEDESDQKETVVQESTANITDDGTPPTPPEEEFVPVSKRTTRQQFTSKPFFMVCFFFSIHASGNIWNLTTMRDFLAYLGDNEYDNRYLTIFTLLMPASIVALPFVDTVILKFGFTGGLQGINLLALGYGLIKVASSNLNVQVLGFVLFSFYRSFLFGVTFSFLPNLLAESVVGKAAGIMYAIAGVAGLINIPLADVAVRYLDGNFFIPNLIILALVLPCFAAAWGLGRYLEREKKHLESIHHGKPMHTS